MFKFSVFMQKKYVICALNFKEALVQIARF